MEQVLKLVTINTQKCSLNANHFNFNNEDRVQVYNNDHSYDYIENTTIINLLN